MDNIIEKTETKQTANNIEKSGFEPDAKSVLNTLLILGRVSNLPTVWSNSLAGWMLAGGGDIRTLLNLCFGVSCLYIGGMFMNDACDANYDRIYRPERPIPAGKIQERTVWLLSITFLVIGAISISHISNATAFLTTILLSLILLYNSAHKKISFSPTVIGLCRLLLYLLGASVAKETFNGIVLWSGIVLAIYVMGISWIAKYESKEGIFPSRLAVVPLFCPVALAIVVNDEEYRIRGIIAALALIIWLVDSLRILNKGNKPEIIMDAVSRLLAGIILVDMLAVVGSPTQIAHYLVVFPILLILTLFLQKFIPST